MKILAIVCRILLGLLFVFSGVNGLHPFKPMPPLDPSTPLAQFTSVMMSSGWMSVVFVFQLIGGLLVLVGGTVPLGLCILCPITVNILLCHFCLMGGKGVVPGAITTLLELVLIWAYRANFSGILTAKATPTASA